MLRIGVIGYGNRITGIVDKLISTGEVELAAITDIRNDEIRNALEKRERAVSRFIPMRMR